MIAIKVEPLEVLKARYPAAIAHAYDLKRLVEWSGDGTRPGDKPEHVFDFPEGLRLIVSLELFEDGRRIIHLSASLSDRLAPEQVARLLGLKNYDRNEIERLFRSTAETLFYRLSGRAVPPDAFVGWSAGKGVPHWAIPEVQ